MNRLGFTSALIASLCLVSAAAKRPLNHDDFDAWQSVYVNSISRSGLWSIYSVNPQEGDGIMSIRNNKTDKVIALPRGYKPAFSADEKWALALIKPLFADTRKAKIDKKKDADLPKDTLAIINLTTGNIEKIPFVTSYKIGEKGGDFFAYQSCDTLHIKPEYLKDKESGRPLIIRSLSAPTRKIVKWVKNYDFSKDGRHISLLLKKNVKDSVATDGVALINLPDTSLVLFDREMKSYTLPVFNDQSDAVAYTATNDTIDSGTKRYELRYTSIGDLLQGATPQNIPVMFTSGIPVNLALPNAANPDEQAALEKQRDIAMKESAGDELLINQYSTPAFSKNGRFLRIGVAPVIAPDDTTLVDFEKASLDIWRWDAPYTPPQEKANLAKLRERSLPVVIDLKNGFGQQLLTKNQLASVEPSFGWDAEWVLLHDPSDSIISKQWNYLNPEKLTAVNVVTGKRVDAGVADYDASALSPDGRFILIYRDRNYYAFEIATGKTVNLTENLPYPIWTEDDDHPMPSQPIGIAAWGDNDGRVLVYDMFDIWVLDMTGATEPINFTAGYGRKNNLRLRYHNLDKESGSLKPGELMILDVIDNNTKERGLATTKYTLKKGGGNPTVRLLDKYKITQLTKAQDAQQFVWQRANFNTLPDLWTVRGLDFAKARQITNANPQAADISWGTAELVEWYAYDGKKAQGVLYLPEGFDPVNGNYPMLSVFYETNADELYMHYTMEPSWSWVNYPFYVSRGYVVFVPDIHYTAGVPGECAYNYVCSGVEEMLKRYPSIDPERLGIDGQSWGGYQTAYLVTRTNMFACAGSGAPVSNMTSAYGGIRWGSGDSRQVQYEMGQSRIGRNLWESPYLYIANSPLFFADRVETPLLIMHNDADGAVPWYQGIEFFMALRRLNKPVWMLQYNDEAHNLRERRNRKDITRRLQQFFDHYLKGEPMPRWMKQGISPLRKGQDYGF